MQRGRSSAVASVSLALCVAILSCDVRASGQSTIHDLRDPTKASGGHERREPLRQQHQHRGRNKRKLEENIETAPLFCDFSELVDSIESHVSNNGDNGGAHEALWARCRDLYAYFESTGAPTLILQPVCGHDGPVCEWRELVESYLLQGETIATPMLESCVEMRDLGSRTSCTFGNQSSDIAEPSMAPTVELANTNLTAGNYTF
eukprot:SAG11_NODE_4918_length_1722_cov_1.762785_1_plen_203_part_01